MFYLLLKALLLLMNIKSRIVTCERVSFDMPFIETITIVPKSRWSFSEYFYNRNKLLLIVKNIFLLISGVPFFSVNYFVRKDLISVRQQQ